MVCIFCAPWNQDDPNCGHAMVDDYLLPARYINEGFRLTEVLGSWRAARALFSENGGDVRNRVERIVDRFRPELAGAW